MSKYQPEIEHVDGVFKTAACDRLSDARASMKQEFRKSGVYAVKVRRLADGKIVDEVGKEMP